MEILSNVDLPSWVNLPQKYLELIKNGQDEFLPWYITDRQDTMWRYKGIKERYKNRRLFPFARCDYTDDIACWEEFAGEKVFIIHDYASPGWEQRQIFNNFDEWYMWALKQQEL